jgi:uncharacterized OB-fold protein
VTEPKDAAFGDPLSRPFWEAAGRRELVIQRCRACGQHQFYPRPFCLQCFRDELEWVRARGTGTIYSQTTVRAQIAPGFTPPYVAAIVELDEGPRLATNIVGGTPNIGDRVRVTWRERDGQPPLPVFEPLDG